MTDEGIDYELDGRSGLRPYAGLKAVRIQLFSPAPNLSALIQLDFIKGWPLVVHSSTLDGQIAEGRSRAFVDFLADLHRRLSPQDRARIVFRRGFSPIRHLVITIGAVVIAVPTFGLLLLALVGQVPIGKAIWPGIPGGLLAAGFLQLAFWSRPGSYDPERLPDGLWPRN
ncbi:hypothetical protein [Bosea sp. OAE506]|uniref:hypothetical protein n=1 Tax=Bosea sp. OAE506 TaxID=2663870 RepID=UPI00178B4B3E